MPSCKRFVTVEFRSTPCFRLRARSLSLTDVRDVVFCYAVETQINWMNTEEFQNPVHMWLLQICSGTQIIRRQSTSLTAIRRHRPPSHKATEPMPTMGHDYPFNPFRWCRAGKKCHPLFPQHALLGKEGSREKNVGSWKRPTMLIKSACSSILELAKS